MNQEDFGTNYGGSLVLRDVEIDGSIRSEKDICIEGKVRGDICCRSRVIVKQGGIVEGNVACEGLITDGLVTGDVESGHFSRLFSHAVIKGHLITSCLSIHPEAVIEEGLRFKG